MNAKPVSWIDLPIETLNQVEMVLRMVYMPRSNIGDVSMLADEAYRLKLAKDLGAHDMLRDVMAAKQKITQQGASANGRTVQLPGPAATGDPAAT